MFEQSLSGLIKALRATRNDEQAVIQQALAEISREVRSSDWDLKAGAVLKLTYLDMLGHAHLAQHAFPVIECMASAKPHIKQIGYLAASQSFMQGTEVILLANNLIKKDLSNNKVLPTELLLTLASLPPILNSSTQLATDLEPELLRQLSHSKPQVRRSAVLVLGSVWKSRTDRQGEAIVEKLAEKLVDEDASVVGATVNVMLELTKASEQAEEDLTPFLRLAPECFELLTTSTNNWMLIKIIKWVCLFTLGLDKANWQFALLTPVEPRLLRKLLPPITDLIRSTSAMSLLYECIHALIAGGMIADDVELAHTCITKLATFLTDTDQNLRYIALLALIKLLPVHPHLIAPHSHTILKCVDDPDISIRSRALELVEGMVDRDSLQATVKRLMALLSPSKAISASTLLASIANGAAVAPTLANTPFKVSLVTIILKITSTSSYANIEDFAWFIDLLFQLAQISETLRDDSLTQNIGNVFIDVVARVKGIRSYAATTCIAKVNDGLLVNASAWIIGEYCTQPEEWTNAIRTLQNIGRIYDAAKILARWASYLAENGDWRQDSALSEFLACNTLLLQSEANDQSSEILNLLAITDKDFQSLEQMATEARDQESRHNANQQSSNPFASDEDSYQQTNDTEAPRVLSMLSAILFAHKLNAVNERAQSLVAIPEGLDLDSWIVPGCISTIQSKVFVQDVDEYGRPKAGFLPAETVATPEIVTKSKKKRPKQSKEEVNGQNQPKTKKKSSKRKQRAAEKEETDLDEIPIVKIDLASLNMPHRRPVVPMTVDAEGELPPGAENSNGRLPKVPSVERDPSPAPVETAKDAAITSTGPIEVTKVKKSKSKSTSRKRKEGASRL